MQHKAPYQKTLVGILAAAGILSLAGCGPQAPAQDATQPTTSTPPATETNAVGVQQVTTPTSHESDKDDRDDRDERGDDDRKQAVTQHPINKPTATATTPSTATTTATATQGINGTFHLTNTYGSPAGPEPLDATVTLKDGVITAVSAKNVAKHQRSKLYQDMFITGIAGSIVGKNIKDVNVTHVNGSSLTAASFNTALHELQK